MAALPEIENVLDQHGYDTLEVIGKGGYAECYLVQSRKYNMPFACKIIDITKINGRYKSINNESEYEALIKTIHPNIIQIYEKIFTPTHIYLILEYCENGDLMKYLRHHGRFTDQQTLLKNVLMMLNALEYLHENKIAHSDIKPSNFLIDQYGRLKLTDFGLTKTIKDETELSEDFCGSLLFMAPEIVSFKPFNPLKADIWAFGVTLFVMALGYFPFMGKEKSDVIESIKSGVYCFTEKTSPFIKMLIDKCLKLNPNERSSFTELRYLVERELKTLEPYPKKHVKSISSLNKNQFVKSVIVKPRQIRKARSTLL